MANPTPSTTVKNYGTFGPDTQTLLETVFLVKESGGANQTINPNITMAGTLGVTGAVTLSSTLKGGQKPIIATAATIAPTAAQTGSIILFGALTGTVVTLPAPVVGLCYDLVISVTNTSNSNEIRTNAGTVFLLGGVQHSASGIAPLDFWADGTTIQAIKMNGGTTGGLIGSSFRVLCISATQWSIAGINLGTATMTTAFTATP